MKYLSILTVALLGLFMIPGDIIGHSHTPDPLKSIELPSGDTLSSINCLNVENSPKSTDSTRTDKELFEKTVSIIKHYESLHQAEHWPYIGYGHKVQGSDKYTRGVVLSKKQADQLLRKDLKIYLDMYRDFGQDAYLLAALAYSCGHGRVNKSAVLAKLKRGDRDIRESYLAHSRAGGKFRRQLYERRIEEYETLFRE